MEERYHSMQEYFVQREVLNELRLDEVAQKETSSTGPNMRERLKKFSR